MDVDPLASMRCWAIDIQLGGRVYEIPALPAADWWPVLTSGDLGSMLDFAVSSPDNPFELEDLLLDGKVDGAELSAALTDAIEEIAGRSLHAAMVLAYVAGTSWPVINGSLVRRGFRWDQQPLGAALDAIYSVVTENLDKDGLAKFLGALENESLTNGKPTGRQREKIASEFESMAGPKPKTGVKATAGQSGSARPRTRTRPRPPLLDAP